MPSELTLSVDHAETLLRSKDYVGARAAAEDVLGNLASLSRAALVRGNALLHPLLEQMTDRTQDTPSRAAFQEAREMFHLALRLDPENATAQTVARNMESILEMLLPVSVGGADGRTVEGHAHTRNRSSAIPSSVCLGARVSLDVVIVGAGASGVGVAHMLTQVFRLDPHRVLLLERGATVGETFRRWPREMRFISPSFNQQGWTASFDLNSVAFGSSPAFSLHAEHPSGEQYAAYLSALAEAAGLLVWLRTEVLAIRRHREGGFDVEVAGVRTDGGEVGRAEASRPRLLWSRFVIWAAGEFQYPATETSFPGSELCRHNSSVRSWAELPGDDFIVIGGYESGVDAASNLAACGKRSTVLASTAYWNVATADPSTELAPYTAERLRAACISDVPPRLLAPLRVVAVQCLEDDSTRAFLVHAQWGPAVTHSGTHLRATLYEAPGATAHDCTEGSELVLRTQQPPLLCSGFLGSVGASAIVRDLFEWSGGDGQGGCSRHGVPLLTERDESTKTPGLFLVGPSVQHEELSFCFVYKFRQRFAIVAEAIARGLGFCTKEAVEQCRKTNMYLDDFECCRATCGDTYSC